MSNLPLVGHDNQYSKENMNALITRNNFMYNFPRCYASLTAPDDTTITTGETFQAIEGTFSNDPIVDFSETTVGGSPALQYDGTQTLEFEIDYHATFQTDTATETVRFGIRKNTETLTATSDGVQSALAKNASQDYALSGTRVVSLATGDTIQLVVTSTNTGTVVTVNNYNTSIKRFN